MSATIVGVRHHSPACARLVQHLIAEQRPAYVLVEGPADMNDRMDEVLLDHDLPVAIFTSYRDDDHHHVSWSPLCAHSPEWVALREGRRSGAEVRFVDLPAWHPALADRSNRYADAERRHDDAIDRLCRVFAVDNIDTLWDHLFEIDSNPDLATHLAAYFDLIRGDANASDEDAEREAYMAAWVRAAVADASSRPVVVVTGGFHRSPLVELTENGGADDRTHWPDVPPFPDGAVGGSYLVPFSFRRLDAFDGYQSGMPSPGYYQRLWEDGVEAAGADIVASVATRLRRRRQPVSTADLVAAHTLALGLARLRGHRTPGRTDVLDSLVSALVTDPLDAPLPWTGRGRLRQGTDPVVVEMVAALSGETVGRLHPATPPPPLVHDVDAELERHGIPAEGLFSADLTTPSGLGASRVLNRLRLLGIPGTDRRSGPVAGADPVLVEVWELRRSEFWLAAVIEAGSYGATVETAAGAALGDMFLAAGSDPSPLATVLFDAALCGLDDLAERVVADVGRLVGGINDVGGLGDLLATVLGLWRHDHLLGAAGSPPLARVVDAATSRALWLVEGIRGGPAPADDARLRAIVAVRDAVIHAEPVLGLDRTAVLGAFVRSLGPDRPPDLRGAAVGMISVLEEAGAGGMDEVERSIRSASRPDMLGDFLAGLFALAREQVLAGPPPGLLGCLDEIVGHFTEPDFLVALPSLRLAFSWFPPRERETIAQRLLDLRGVSASAASLLRLVADPALVARGRSIEARVAGLLTREALLDPPDPPDQPDQSDRR
jgi:hypothetical protein